MVSMKAFDALDDMDHILQKIWIGSMDSDVFIVEAVD